MIKNRSMFSWLLLGILSLYFLKSPNKKKQNNIGTSTANNLEELSIGSPTHKERKPGSQKSVKLSEALKEPLPLPKKHLGSNSKKNLSPPECQDEESNLIQSGAENFLEKIQSGQESLKPTCRGISGKNHFTFETLYEYCQLDTQAHKLRSPKACLDALTVYRAVAIDNMTSESKDFSQMSLGVLLNKAVSHIAATKPDQNWTDTRAIVDEIIKIQPNDPTSYKLLNMVEIMNPSQDSKRGLENAYNAILKNPEDIDLRDSYAYFQSRQLNFNIKNYVLEHPNDQYIQYYYAQKLASDGQSAEAIKVLSTIALKYPDNTKYGETLNELQTTGGQKAAQAFHPTLNLDMQNF